MINKTVLRMISRNRRSQFRDFWSFNSNCISFIWGNFKTELFESGKLSVHRRWYNDTSMRGRRWLLNIITMRDFIV